MKTYLTLSALMLATIACKRKTDSVAMMLVAPKMMAPKPGTVRFPPPVVKADASIVEKSDAKYAVEAAPRAGQTILQDTSKKIVKQGDISFEASNIIATRKALLKYLVKFGGYADEDNESVDSGTDRKEYVIKARIPAKNFDTFLDIVSSGAVKIDSKHISVTDVTTQYIDMNTRLHNQKLLEGTYLSLLKRASKMSDVLEIEGKLTDTRTEIESEQGQLNYLNKQIAYSSLDITFYTKQIQHDTGNTASYRLGSAFSGGWIILQELFFGLITLWPVVLLLIGALIFVRNWRKRIKLRSKNND